MSACLLLRGPLCFSFAANRKPYFAISTKTLNCFAMEARQELDTTESHISQSSPDYPKPLSPPPPPISKDLELRRAMEASSRSSLWNLTRDDVLYEDEWLIAVNKPKGIYCEAVLSSVPRVVDPPSGTDEFHLANRLDRDTSGVMLITKSHKVAAKLVKAFTEHKISKSYIALCIAPSPKWERITIRSGHGRSKHGAWRVYAASDVGRVLPGGSVVRDMETTFEVVSINKTLIGNESSELKNEEEERAVVAEREVELNCDGDRNMDEVLVRAFPRSGKTHQIRLHCQYLGIPIGGDVKYHGVYECRGIPIDGHELHAESLSLDHPVKDHRVVVRAPLPYWANPQAK
ncbi:PREDICTED: RNA pseudouridine synthase 1 [Tarenaya hassleriana]|uniref:RNA pseudouridine synthase 1 n=1 Tax=Tarenaya hassleriana TaxID=28532 RepID=UPI00053C841E|nr:PREDICTED: RNA pseudouridine synthase 1 [Tarenaya hassleriana]